MHKLDGNFTATIGAVAVSPDGRWLAANQTDIPFIKKPKHAIRWWDLHDLNKPPEPLVGKDSNSMVFSPGGDFLAYLGAADGIGFEPFPGPGRVKRVLANNFIHSYSFVPNSSTLLAAGNVPFGWDLASNKAFPVVLEGLDFSTDAEGLPYHLLMPTIAVRGDGAVVAGHVTVKLAQTTSLWTWTFPAGKKLAESKPMPRDNDPWGLPAVRRLVYSPDGRFLAGMRMHDLVVWDAETLAELATLTPSGVRDKHHPRAVSALCLAFTPDGQRLAAGCRGGKISFWSTATWKKGCDVDCSCAFVSSLAFSCDGRMIAGAEFCPVVWERAEY